MSNTFMAALIIGLAFMAVMMFLFEVEEFGIMPVVEKPNVTNVTTKKITVIEGFVGPHDKEVWRSIDLGYFNISYQSGLSRYSVDREKVVSGLLFGTKTLKFDIKRPTDFIGAYLEFTVKDTNYYGPLLIFVNNTMVAKKKYNLGKHKLILNDSWIKDGTVLEIKPVSSSWKIWAPNIYELTDVKLMMESLYLKGQEFEFNLYDDEVKHFTRGWVALHLDEKEGEFIEELNDNTVYKDSIEGVSPKLEFEKEDIETGVNTLTFKSEKNAKFSGDATLIIYYRTTKDYTFERGFNLSKDSYEFLDTRAGEIDFKVTEKMKDGGIIVKLNNETLCHTGDACYPRIIKDKVYEFSFGKDKAKTGENKLVIDSVDEGIFVMKAIHIRK